MRIPDKINIVEFDKNTGSIFGRTIVCPKGDSPWMDCYQSLRARQIRNHKKPRLRGFFARIEEHAMLRNWTGLGR